MKSHVQDPRRLHATAQRQKLYAALRDFFSQTGYLETPTPTLVTSPGMEVHIRPLKVRVHGQAEELNFLNHKFLQTSPEFAMKKLLAGGLQRIFQFATVFRAEPYSPLHLPEFQMLEWYEAKASMEDLMQQCESLFLTCSQAVTGSSMLSYQGNQIHLAAPWPRLRVEDLFAKHCGIRLREALDQPTLLQALQQQKIDVGSSPENRNWEELYFLLWLNHIEPHLPKNQPCFVTDYPPSQAALARLKKDAQGQDWARRFEIYVGGIELANAFEELCDPNEQRRRFIQDMQERQRIYGDRLPANPVDEDFLNALGELPECSGIALGLDRWVMLLADENDIRQTVWFS